MSFPAKCKNKSEYAHTGEGETIKKPPQTVEIRAVCAFTGLQTEEDESGFPRLSLPSCGCQHYASVQESRIFFNACMRIKVKPLVSAMQ